MRTLELLEFVHLPSFRRSITGLIDEEGERALEEMLIGDPAVGAVIVGTEKENLTPLERATMKKLVSAIESER